MSEDDEERQLRIELMTTQIEKLKREMRWQPWIAMATILAAVAAMSGVIVGVAHLIH